jgi:hypothetical protein
MNPNFHLLSWRANRQVLHPVEDDEFLIQGGKPGKYKMIPYGPPFIEILLLNSS